MTDFLTGFHGLMRIVHIVLGFAGLFLFWVPVFAVKGGRLHRVTGQLFALITVIVAGTALVSCAWALLDPVSFVGPRAEKIPASEWPATVDEMQFFFGLLGFLSLGTLSGILYGVAVVWYRQLHERLRSAWVLGPQIAFLLGSFALLVVGVWHVSGWAMEVSESSNSKYWLHVFLGLFGLYGCWEDIGYIVKPRAYPQAWWPKHMECMLGAGIAFHTAFLVLGVNRVVGLHLPGAWQLVPWILPSLVGIPAISIWTWQYERKWKQRETDSLLVGSEESPVRTQETQAQAVP